MKTVTLLVGIVAIIFAVITLSYDEKSELQATNTILDTIQGFDRLLWTDIEVIQAPEKCREGW